MENYNNTKSGICKIIKLEKNRSCYKTPFRKQIRSFDFKVTSFIF